MHFLIPVDRNYLITSLILIAILFSVLLVGKQGPLIELYDYWEHTASIKEMSKNLFDPKNPFLQLEGQTTLRFTPYIFIAALIKKTAGFDLYSLLVLLSLVNFILLTIGIYLFCGEYFHDREQPFYTLITLLFLWGAPFNFSSEYNLRFLSYTAFYPSEATFALSFIGFFYFLRFVRYDSSPDYWKYLLLAVFIFAAHPLTGSFFLLGIFLLTLSEGKKKFKNAAFYLFSVLVVILITFLWPYYPFLKAFQNTVSTPWAEETRGYLYATRNIYKMGPAALGLPVIVFMIAKRRYHFISYGCVLCTAIYVLTYKPKIYLGERYIFYIIVFLHLALAYYLRTLRVLSFTAMKATVMNLSEKNIHVLIFAAIVMLSIFYQIAKLGFEQMGYTIDFKPRPIVQRYENPVEKYKTLAEKIQHGDIVLSDPLTSWLIPTLTDAKIVALYHDNPLVPDNAQRVEQNLAFYDKTTDIEERKLILKKYNVTHVLLNFDRMRDTVTNRINDYYTNYVISEPLIADLQRLGRITFSNDHFSLYEINTQEW